MYNPSLLLSQGFLCTKIADNLVGEASIVSSVSFFGSKYAMTFALVRRSLIF